MTKDKDPIIVRQYTDAGILGFDHQNSIESKQKSRDGVVYTPLNVVDFIVRSTNDSVNEKYDANLCDAGVKIIDPFTGVGVFIIRAIQLGLLGSGPWLRAKLLRDMLFCEIDPQAFRYATDNICRAANALSANVTEAEISARGHCGDTFEMDDAAIDAYFPPRRWDDIDVEKLDGYPAIPYPRASAPADQWQPRDLPVVRQSSRRVHRHHDGLPARSALDRRYAMLPAMDLRNQGDSNGQRAAA